MTDAEGPAECEGAYLDIVEAQQPRWQQRVAVMRRVTRRPELISSLLSTYV
jgi:hypothetical protein